MSSSKERVNVGMAATMCECALQLGGMHFVHFCKFPPGKMVNPCQTAEISIWRLMRSAQGLEYIHSLDVLFD